MEDEKKQAMKEKMAKIRAMRGTNTLSETKRKKEEKLREIRRKCEENFEKMAPFLGKCLEEKKESPDVQERHAETKVPNVKIDKLIYF